MKNVTYVNGLQSCAYCELQGFFCYTPVGADYVTCPCCRKYDFLNANDNDKYKNTKFDFLFEEEFDDDLRNTYQYCDHCNIIYSVGCVHSIRGCTDDVYNCHFIKKWKDKSTNIEYEGMPLFADTNDWFENVNNVVVLQMYCPHNGDKCEQTRYPISGTRCGLEK
jgi:hypothetical protein